MNQFNPLNAANPRSKTLKRLHVKSVMNHQAKRFYEFDSFRIDTEERQLLRDGRPLTLTPKVFDLLLFLVENRGHTLGKDELMQQVWADTFVEENNLSRNISMLRKILGDDLHESRFIKTVPKRGYRFDSDVKEILEDEEALIVERRTNYSVAIREEIQKSTKTSKDAESSFSITGFVSHYRVVTALFAAAMLMAALALTMNWTRNPDAQPLMRGTTDAEAFELYQRGRTLWQNRSAAGLHEATLLLEQAVEKDPNFALGFAALADAYAFDVGKWQMTEAVANRAIELDPSLGEPHASIGFVKLFWEWKPAEAEARFKRAVTLSPDYATGHEWYAIRFAANGQFNQALAEMNRALELEPNSIAINADVCQMLYFVGRYDEAETQCKKTLELDADSFNAHSYLYAIYVAKGRYDEAVEEFFKREGLSVNHSTLPGDFKDLKTAFENGGIRSFWRAHVEMLKRPTPDKGYTLAQNYARLGEKEEALLHLQRAYENRDFGFVLLGADPVFSDLFEDPRYVELRSRLFIEENSEGG